MKNFIRILLLCLLTLPAFAEEGKQATVADIEQAEAYLHDMKTAKARFVQTTHNGTQLVGTFYLERPGKLRFDYDPPIENFVVADGVFLYFYDAELQEQTNMPIRTSLANFFLRKDFSFTNDVIVQEAIHSDGLLQLRIVQEDDPEGGSITFGFSNKPFELKKWRVVDQQGLITEVELFHLKVGVDHKDGLFVYNDPKKDGKSSYNN
ncbi:MAG: outer membrane lipoprotein carrier protein LolA [Alphaproteobacteria bacterium]|nr:outer membrane lipoprotein carrier protein LolA [Alphaproteobacteria bacterium]